MSGPGGKGRSTIRQGPGAGAAGGMRRLREAGGARVLPPLPGRRYPLDAKATINADDPPDRLPFPLHLVSALPFIITQSTDAFADSQYTSTTETAHGLLRLERDRLVIQWRVHRTTDRMGAEFSSREEQDPVREISVPLAQLASAELRHRWAMLGGKPRLVLTASDLRAFEGVAGPAGLSLGHPSRLEFTLQRHDADAGRDFAAELGLAIGDCQLRLAEGEGRSALPP